MAAKKKRRNGPTGPIPPSKSLRPKKAAFLRTMAKTGNITTAAELCNIARSNHYDWMREDPEYPALFDAAMETAIDKLEEEAVRRAVEGDEEPIYQNGQLVGTKCKKSDVLLMFALNGARPEKYRRVTETRSTNLHRHLHQIDLTGMSDEKIRQAKETLLEITRRPAPSVDAGGSGNGASLPA